MPLEDVLMFAMAVRAGGPQADERCGAGQSDVERSRVEMEWTWSGVKWSTVQSGRVCCAGWRPGGSISTSSSASPHRAQHLHIELSIATSGSASPHRAQHLHIELESSPSICRRSHLRAHSMRARPRSGRDRFHPEARDRSRARLMSPASSSSTPRQPRLTPRQPRLPWHLPN